MLPAIYALAGDRLRPDERVFFGEAEPAGYILFKRNVATLTQLRELTDELRGLHARDDLPILIDQEGGRVARLQPPDWPPFPAAERFDALYRVAPMTAIEAARLNAQAIASVLREAGITVDCLPLLDVRQPGAHDIIGDRALGSEPMQVAALGRAILDGLRDGGVVGVVKHMPGHGRAGCDSHVDLPVIEASEEELQSDLEPFISLRDAPIGMMAHIVYSAWDGERPASQSRSIIDKVIRGRIGFDGLLLSDDIGMEALAGSPGERAAGVIAAGCDLALHCSGVLTEMVAVASALDEMGSASKARLDRAMATVHAVGPGPPYQDLAARRDALLSYA